MTRRIKQILVGTGILFGLILLLSIGILSYMKTDHARRLIQDRVNDLIPGTVLCEGLHFSLLKGEFELRRMLLKDPSGNDMAGCDRFFVDFTWSTLFNGELTVETLIIEKPWTTIRVDKKNKINLMRAFPASKATGQKTKREKGIGIPFNIVLKSLELVQGSVHFELFAEDLNASANNINVTADGDFLKRSGNLMFCIGKGHLESPEIQTEFDRFKLKATLKDGRIDPLILHSGATSSEITLSGNIGDVFNKPIMDLTLDLSASLAEMQKTFCLKPMSTGRVEMQLNALGALDNPQVIWRLSYGGGIISGQQVDRIDLDCRLEDRFLTLNKLQAQVASGDLNIQGEIDLRDAFTNGFLNPQRDLKSISYNAFMRQKKIRLEELLPGVNPIEGIIQSSLSVCGKGISPHTLSAKIGMELFATDFTAGPGTAPIDVHLKSEASLNQGVATIKDLVAATGDIKFQTNGHIDLSSEELSATITLDAPSITGILSSLGVQKAHGKLGLKGNVSGSIKQPVLDFVLKGDELCFREIRIEKVRLNAGLDKAGILRVSQIAIDNQGSAFHGAGWIHIFKKDFSASLSFDETDLSPYFKIANQPDIKGTLTGKIKAGGNVESMDQVKASVDLSKVALLFKDKEIVHARNLKIFLDKDKITIPLSHLFLFKTGEIDIKGTGTLNGPLALQMEGRIPLEAAGLFVEDLSDATGDLALSATVGGTQAHPDIHAEIELKKIAFTVPTLLQKIHDLNGRIHLNSHTITIDPIKGRLDAGRFDLAGKIDLKAFQPVKVIMNVNANALPLQVPDTMDMLLNTELKICGTQDKSTIQGEIVILEGTYYRDVDLNLIHAVQKKKREVTPLPTKFTQPFLKNTTMDISVKHRLPIIVDNNLAHLEIAPDLHITGNLNNPVVSGQAEIKSGKIEYKQKTFVIKRGTIDFVNPYKTEPILDIKSEAQIRDWLIYLNISGALDQLVFKLTSDPLETDGDILSLLVFGKTTHELIEGEKGASQTTTQMLAELIFSTFGEDIQDVTGLDILEVETKTQGNEKNLENIKITVGENLSRRITVKYATEMEAGEMSQRAIAEYKFLEHILISGFQDSKGIFGGNLRFRLEFR